VEEQLSAERLQHCVWLTHLFSALQEMGLDPPPSPPEVIPAQKEYEEVRCAVSQQSFSSNSLLACWLGCERKRRLLVASVRSYSIELTPWVGGRAWRSLSANDSSFPVFLTHHVE